VVFKGGEPVKRLVAPRARASSCKISLSSSPEQHPGVQRNSGGAAMARPYATHSAASALGHDVGADEPAISATRPRPRAVLSRPAGLRVDASSGAKRGVARRERFTLGDRLLYFRARHAARRRCRRSPASLERARLRRCREAACSARHSEALVEFQRAGGFRPTASAGPEIVAAPDASAPSGGIRRFAPRRERVRAGPPISPSARSTFVATPGLAALAKRHRCASSTPAPSRPPIRLATRHRPRSDANRFGATSLFCTSHRRHPAVAAPIFATGRFRSEGRLAVATGSTTSSPSVLPSAPRLRQGLRRLRETVMPAVVCESPEGDITPCAPSPPPPATPPAPSSAASNNHQTPRRPT